jgi:CxxC motif-containing protein
MKTAEKVRSLVCISCPLGCHLEVYRQDGGFRVSGNKCPRGKTYALEEMLAPKRVVTATVRLRARALSRLPVKTTGPLPKEQITGLLNEIYRWTLEPPVSSGQVLLADIAGTGIDLVVTRTVAE